ncbi:RMD1 family protein [Paenibacillus sp.]|uniref:RMD1 family protein n=1 Tax=Paenibacillus sp. TaxID=58172 RepID=UPI002D4A60FD|nr:RMD1 family protein [Paenibacillus sp.]HZG58716.1 RMD1 family protein [Paenibacillus sp.]
MQAVTFKAFAVANEIDLNRIATRCGIPKKFTWEQPLALRGETLGAILRKPVQPTQAALVFAFGSVVFVDIDLPGEIKTFLNYLHAIDPAVDVRHVNKYADDYRLHVEEGAEGVRLTDESVVVPAYESFYPELISTTLAKSVALERTEEELGKITDKLETVIDRLEKGKLRVGNKELARTTARIVRHEYNTLAYIMILDKPDVTWTSGAASDFYEKMSEFFELNDRYKIMKSKTETLYHIMEGFSTISHSMRGLFVEWIIVFLIVFEVVLTLLEMAGLLP